MSTQTITRGCSIDGCEQPHKGHGLCNKHLIRQRRTGTTDTFVRSQESRFWEKVSRGAPDECWNWMAATNDHGYGVMRPAGQRSGPCMKAHRYSAQLAGMDIDGKHVLHSCDNPLCVNPAHLRPGNDAENMRDALDRGRIPVGSGRRTSKLTESEVSIIKERLAGGVMHKDIAGEFGVSRVTITHINAGHTWKHVTPPSSRDLYLCVAEALGA